LNYGALHWEQKYYNSAN